MLPGLRTLAATVLLAVAIVTFAFGAAALLRAAHEDFATLQTWRPAIDPLAETVAAKNSGMPVLATLRVEPEPEATEQFTAPAQPVALPAPPPAEDAIAPQPAPPPAAVVASLPAQPETELKKPEPKIELSDAPYNAPLSGPRLMPEIATNDAPLLAVASLAPVVPDVEPIAVAPLPRPKPQITQPLARKRIVKRAPARRVATRAAAQPQATTSPFGQLFNSAN